MQMEAHTHHHTSQLFPTHDSFPQRWPSFPEPEHWPSAFHKLELENLDAQFKNPTNSWHPQQQQQQQNHHHHQQNNGSSTTIFPASPQMNGLGMKDYFGNGNSVGSLPNMLQQKLKQPCGLEPEVVEAEPDELFGSMQELESHALGRLLPDAEEDLLLAENLDRAAQLAANSSGEEEFDIFNSVGGMELENDMQNLIGNYIINNYPVGGGGSGGGAPGAAAPNGNGAVSAGEHPYGEHPSRTLFVRNINSNVEDTELRALFEQYGAIRTLYTACKHRGFVMISYYDIRAARTAMRALQNKPLRRRKLDIHFSIPKDNPSDKDVNQGTLVVFNLDASVSNDDLRQIFGVYGEIKEIRETPHKKHHKFIEFYDVRAAEAALRALNRSDIAGKRIKLEPSRPGGARRSLMQQLTQELEQEEFRCQQMQGALGTSPAGHSPQWSKLNEAGAACRGVAHPTFSIKPINGAVGSLPARVSSPLRNGMSSSTTGDSPMQNLSIRIRQQFPSLQIPELDSPGFGPFDELENAHLHRTVSALREVPAVDSPRAMPGSRNGLALDPVWSNSNPFFSQFPSSPSMMYSGDGFGEGNKQRYFPEASPGWSLGGLRNGGSNGVHVLGSSHGAVNLAALASKGVVDSPRLGVLSPQQRARSFPNGGLESFSDRCRSRRGDASAALAENKKYQLDLGRILHGDDPRTTLMIKNIPNKYTSKMLLATIDEHHRGTYDFIYLPIDFKNKCNVGYAFINMIEPAHIVPFYKTFNGKKWEKFNSEKVASLAYARIQGKVALVAHFQNSSLMNEDKRCRPILFHSAGPNLGDPEPFPVGSNVRTRPGRDRNGLYQFETSSTSSSCSSKDEELEMGQSSSDVEKD